MTAMQRPHRCPMDRSSMRPEVDFPIWWQRAAVEVGLPAEATPEHLSLSGVGLARLLKQLQALDAPRRALLMAMACLANPNRANWLQREHDLHFGQLTAADLGQEVFQVLVGLLATFPTPQPTQRSNP